MGRIASAAPFSARLMLYSKRAVAPPDAVLQPLHGQVLRESAMKAHSIRKVLSAAFPLLLVVLATLLPSWSATFKVLHHFAGGSDGEFPSWALKQDPNGNLLGTTYGGGQFQGGVALELSPNQDNSWSESVLYNFNFNSDEGSSPATGLALDSNGNLYGSTISGGPTDGGTVFELSPGPTGWTISLVSELSGASSMVVDNVGTLYGALGPGDYEAGAIAQLSQSPQGWTYSVLYSFCAHPPQCPDGEAPAGPLTWDSAGNLYGTTLYGGKQQPYCTADSFGCGVVFQLTPVGDGTWTYHLLHGFAASSQDGQSPSGTLVIDRNGSVYGTTASGGPTGGGTVFRLTPSTVGRGWVETTLYTFPDCALGCSPIHGLAIDKAGNLYGSAGGGEKACPGGVYCGVLFRLVRQRNGSWKYTVLHTFTGSDGAAPNGVIVGEDGSLYGTTVFGGESNKGVAFEITP